VEIQPQTLDTRDQKKIVPSSRILKISANYLAHQPPKP